MARAPGMMTMSGAGRGGPLQPLIFVLVVLLVMIGTVVWLSRFGGKERDPVPVAKVELEAIPRIEVESQQIPWDPRTEEWGEVNDLDRSGQRGIPTASLKVAVERVGARSWDSFRSVPTTLDPEWVGFRRLDIPRLFEATPELRGQPFSVVGTLVSFEVVDVFDAYDRLKLHDGSVKSWQGVIQPDARVHGSSVPVRFLMVDSFEDEPQFIPGSPVKLQGAFFKLQEITVDEETKVGPWLLGKGLFRSFKVPAADEIDLALLAGVVDDRSIQTRRHVFEDQQLFHLFADALLRPDREREAPIEMTGAAIQSLVKKPDAFRGKRIGLQARVLKVEEIPLASFFPENAEGDHAFDTIWVTYLTTDAKVPLTVAWPKKPNIDLELSDQVRLDPVFYRLWGYRAAKGSWLRAPFLVGIGDIKRVDVTEGAGMSASIAIGLVSFFLLTLALVVIALRKDRKKAELFTQRRAARRKVQRGSLDLNEVAQNSSEQA